MSNDLNNMRDGRSTTHFLEVYCPHLLWNLE